MGFFKDISSNFFALVFGLLGIASICFSFVACAVGGMFGGGGAAAWVPF